ncbi:MAG: phenylacetate--CoA ligase family protein [Candidatus Binatia bacterium]
MAGQSAADFWSAAGSGGRAALLAAQWARLTSHLANVYRRNKYYRRVFDAAGLTPEAIRTPADYRRLPTTAKQDVLADLTAHPPFGHRLQVPRRRLAGLAETSGTSGAGQEVYAKTARDRAVYHRMERIGFDWAGIRAGRVVAFTFPLTTTAAGQWYYAALLDTKAIVLPLGNYDTRRKLQYLERYGCEVLIASPSYLGRLTAAAAEVGWTPRVQSIIVAGEAYSVATATRIERDWGARLFEQYGCTQGAIGWTCEQGALPGGRRGLIHMLEDLVYCEVIDRATGAPVAPGQEGELVITPLQAEASPLLRFATGDRVRWLPPETCSCGRPLAGIEAGSVARFDNMMKIKMVNVWPDAIDAVVLAPPEVLEYQGEVRLDPATGREEAIVRVEFRREVPDETRAALLGQLGDALHQRIGLHFAVRPHDGPSLVDGSRDGLLKRQRWTDCRGSA